MTTKTIIPPKRPFLLSITCIVGFLYFGLSLPAIWHSNHLVDTWYTAFIAVVTFGCLIGFWKMKKLSLYVFFSTFIVNLLVSIYLDQWTFYSIIIPLTILGTSVLYHHKMN